MAVLRKSLLFILVFSSFSSFSQDLGILAGNIMDEKNKLLPGSTVELYSLPDTLSKQSTVSNNDGGFLFRQLSYGYYRLRIRYIGFQTLTIDSIHVRKERSDFNLPDIILKQGVQESLQEVIVYAEKPLIESKDGNIIFNASESPLTAGSNASELLSTVPLVTKDGDGKISVRGKEPKILIDDKPVELNLQQLQDLLESLPGSSIEKIEVMTNPPPQYANEQGGVINIVTRKGKPGRSGRVSISAGTRGEASVNGSYSYRKQGFALNINAGGSYNYFKSDGHSHRTNTYPDSSNYLNTQSNSISKGLRPNFRANADYDINRLQSFNMVVQLNSNDYLNHNQAEYTNLNRFEEVYKMSERATRNEGNNYNGSVSLSYLMKTKRAGEQLRLIADANRSSNYSDRDFYQQYFYADHTPNGTDSTQQQLTNNITAGYNARVNYDRPIFKKKTILSLGSFYNRINSEIDVDASYLRKPDKVMVPAEKLSNHFKFHQTVANLRASIRQTIASNLYATVGMSAEQTQIWFELIKENRDARNDYLTWLPFANINRRWENGFNLTLSWRRSIRRPGINELNPTIDFSDPYNLRFGNPTLKASTADNFDFVAGKTHRTYFINLGAGYNIVKDIFSRVRTLLPDAKTQTTWENISGRKEYELSTWGGLTLAKRLKLNLSASYTYNQYSHFDQAYNYYRNGGSFTSNVNTVYTPKDVWNITGGFNFNRFANPQGYARWNWSMNAGVQRKFFEKRLAVTLNMIDPFFWQQTRVYTYGPGFSVESYNATRTSNFRLSLGYSLTKPAKKIALPAKK